MRIGSLCTGYGGLDMAVREVLGGQVAWHCQYEPPGKDGRADTHQYAAAILAHHWPHIPNHGDLTTVDWARVEAVDVLTGGFPCQPVSVAGQRAGTTDERWLFDDICRAVGDMGSRPRLLVFENVPGLLTANGGDAMARVVQGLAALGYVGAWRTVAAADVGAAHRRRRVFIVAWPADTPRPGLETRWEGRSGGPSAAQDTDSAARGERRQPAPRQAPGRGARPDAGRRSGAPASDPAHQRQDRPGCTRDGWPGPADSGDPAADTDGGPLRQQPELVTGRGSAAIAELHGVWGSYAPAIARWEHIIGRPAPAPTEPGRTGPRLAARFVEWLMGLPAGHVTDVPGIPRSAQLHALGNGIVPAQAAHALRILLPQLTERTNRHDLAA